MSWNSLDVILFIISKTSIWSDSGGNPCQNIHHHLIFYAVRLQSVFQYQQNPLKYANSESENATKHILPKSEAKTAGQEATNTTDRTPAPRQPKPDGLSQILGSGIRTLGPQMVIAGMPNRKFRCIIGGFVGS